MHTSFAEAAVLLLCAVALRPVAAQWASAAQARAQMQATVASQAGKLQQQYSNIVSMESDTSSCPAQDMSDRSSTALGSVWSVAGAYQVPSFLDPATGSCVRIDLDINGNPLPAAITGRNLPAPVSTACSWSLLGAPWRGDKCYNTESKYAFLNREQCTSASDLGKCTVNPSVYGFSMPTDTSYSVSDSRLQSEICATNTLLGDFNSAHQAMPGASWSFLGMQETGMYRTWPALFQSRTEAQCSGCSDPRFRGWYASAASGPKNVVVVIDTSGSTSTNSRLAYIKEAAGWVINTLSESDFAMVVQFDSTAQRQGTKLLPMNPINRAKLKEYVNSFGSFGGTNFYAAFDMAFDTLAQSRGHPASSSQCHSTIVFLTDGINQPDYPDPRPLINSRNEGPWHGLEMPERLPNSGHEATRIFTYSFGGTSGSQSSVVDGAMLQDIACGNGGLYQAVGDDQAVHLKEVMANYFVYLSAGLAPRDASPGVPISTNVTRWVDVYEDGQGLGQMTGVCARAYNFDVSPPQLFGTVCLGLSMAIARGLSGWDQEWADIQQRQRLCANLSLSWSDLQSLRNLPVGQTSYGGQCSNPASTNGSHTCAAESVKVGPGPEMGSSCDPLPVAVDNSIVNNDPQNSGQDGNAPAVITDTCPPRDSIGNLLDSGCDSLNCVTCATASSGGAITGCEPPPPPPVGPFKITLAASLSAVDAQWQESFKTDVASRLSVSASQINILSISAGSVVVLFDVAFAMGNIQPSAATVISSLPVGVPIAGTQSLVATSVVAPAPPPRVDPPPSATTEDKTGFIVATAVGSAFLFVFVVYLFICCAENKRHDEQPSRTDAVAPAYAKPPAYAPGASAPPAAAVYTTAADPTRQTAPTAIAIAVPVDPCP